MFRRNVYTASFAALEPRREQSSVLSGNLDERFWLTLSHTNVKSQPWRTMQSFLGELAGQLGSVYPLSIRLRPGSETVGSGWGRIVPIRLGTVCFLILRLGSRKSGPAQNNGWSSAWPALEGGLSKQSCCCGGWRSAKWTVMGLPLLLPQMLPPVLEAWIVL